LPLLSKSCTRPAVMEISAVPEELVGGVNVPVHELPTPFVRVPTVPTDLVINELNILTKSSLEVIVSVVD
jgi:hypothetical protein